MLVRAILASYSRLLAGLTLALLAIALALQRAGRQKALRAPGAGHRVHYEPQSRSAVSLASFATDRDRHGFRVPGKVAKRLVEVGQTVDIGQPWQRWMKSTSSCRPSRPRRIPRRHRRAGAGRRRRNRAKDLRVKAGPPMRNWIRPRPPPTRRVRAQSRRTLGRTHQKQPLLCNPGRDTRRGHAT